MRRLRGSVVLLASVALAATVRAQVADHLTCYRIGDPQRLVGIVNLDSAALGLEAGCKLGPAKLYCVPASKTVLEARLRGSGPIDLLPISGPPAPGARVCYRVRCPPRPVADQEVSDQFGHRVLRHPRASLVCAPAVSGPPPASTTTTTIAVTTSTVTTTTVTTTTSTLPACRVDSVSVDPDGTIAVLVPGMQQIPVRIDASGSPGGIFDFLPGDGGVGGTFVCPPTGCSMGAIVGPGAIVDLAFGYTPPASPPPTITLTSAVSPHSLGFTCGPGSAGAMGARTFPVGP
jgi:hypothetical protein